MKEILIHDKVAGCRLDKFLKKYLSKAPSSFIYKMLRKKNITLNGKKASGTELLQDKDIIRLFFSEDTLQKFKGESESQDNVKTLDFYGIKKVYEDEHLIIASKPRGILSQKAKSTDISMNEILRADVGENEFGFKPSILNRLDRNTSGLILFGKTSIGLRYYSDLIQKGAVHKYYLTLVRGKPHKGVLENYLERNENQRKTKISDKGQFASLEICETFYRKGVSLALIRLGTGRTHQIRTQLSGIGHPLVGDFKYGDKDKSEYLLHSIKLELKRMDGEKLIIEDELSPKGIDLICRYGFDYAYIKENWTGR